MPYDRTYHAPIRVARMRAIIRAEDPDILQVSTPFVPALVAATMRSAMIKAYVHHADPIGCYVRPFGHHLIPRRLRTWLEAPAWGYLAWLTKHYDVTVTSGDWLATDLKQRGCQRVEAVDFGIDTEDFGPDRASPTTRRQLLGQLADTPDAKVLLIAGRMAIDKRQSRLVHAVVRLAQKRPVALVLLGDGPERPRLVEAARGLRAFHYLPFTRDRAHYSDVLASVDALVHGSPCETFGFVLAEALASGTPLVVPDVGGAAELGQPDCAERYPAYAGADDVLGAIERLLCRPADELRQACLEAARALPSTADHFRNLFSLYERLLRHEPTGQSL
jgi:alpha-1,6-mannosyltransferase